MYSSDKPSGIAWPRLLSPRAAMVRWILQRMAHAETQAPAERAAGQRAQLHNLLSHAFRAVPFYRDRLASAGFRPERPLTEEIWQRIPILQRSEVQANAEQLKARGLPPGHGEVHEFSSSGSTGIPVRVLKTELSGLFWDAMTAREFLWQGRDPTQPWHSIRYISDPTVAPYPKGLVTPGWGRVGDVLGANGKTYGLDIRADPSEQVEWLQRHPPVYLQTYPSNLAALLDASAGLDRPFPRLQQVVTLAESLPDGLRQRCREQWGARICDIYSATEVGYIALQAPQADHYLVPDEVVRVELLSDTGGPAAPGEQGLVVVTPLHNFAMPLIRYAVGDYAEAGEASPNGRTLPVINRILGRVRNMLHYPDGRKAWPLFSDSRYREVAPVRQLRVIQHALDRLEFQVVAERPLTSDEKAGLVHIVREEAAYPFLVDVTEHAEIPRSAGGKYEDFRSELA
jgi:phenylacetate-CoA ligase